MSVKATVSTPKIQPLFLFTHNHITDTPEITKFVSEWGTVS
jgi:hypothetical protein